jgi:hypothetical protein
MNSTKTPTMGSEIQWYRIIVSDLEARRAIWFGGTDRTEDAF